MHEWMQKEIIRYYAIQSVPSLCNDSCSGNIKRTLTLNKFYERRIRETLGLIFEQPQMNKYTLLIRISQEFEKFHL